ncbi:P-loop containing nucleoside triphosphate hydrolase protein [Xylaria arbuscula]|nr:P-loop containing nucleoside triphosphate hydrolase protein [Xylaria arbuscula]
MYSRYIPPPKGGPDSPITVSNAASTQLSQAPPNSQPTSYARYVPPPKLNQPPSLHTTAPQHVRFDGDDGANGEEPPAKRVKLVQADTTIQNADQKTSKKLKKKKRKSTQLNDTLEDDNSVTNGAIDALEPQMIDQIDEPNGLDDAETQQTLANPMVQARQSPFPMEDTATEEPRKRREKKKKIKPEDTSETLVEPEEEIPLRFQAVLNKKAKSIRKAPEPQQDDIDMADAALVAGDESSKQKKPEIELHGLEPIPQPEPVALDTSAPSYETLPSWLASPIRVSMSASAPFTSLGLTPDLGITPELAERLALKGYKQAFAIQTGVIPLLLPSNCKKTQGDVLVSAATGSGKTLAYTLPVVRDISQSSRYTTRLRALIVVPTRELVRQVYQVFEDCAGVFALDGGKRRPRVAMAMGSQSFEHEQTLLIEREEQYDPEAYQKKLKRLGRPTPSDRNIEEEEEENSGYNTEDEERHTIRRREDKLPTLPDHIITYKSKVDVLICTPGRLVEHVKFTPGFCLDFVRWLVVDEADKLLGQNFQQWLDIVIPRLQTQSRLGARNHKQSNLSGARKVILSATMTRDLDQLEGLKLRLPKLVVLEGSRTGEIVVDGTHQAEHVLPRLLEEAALKVSDANLKPLFLIDLLRSHHVLYKAGRTGQDTIEDDDDTSSSGSDSESDSSSDSDLDVEHTGLDKPATLLKKYSKVHDMPTVLIFTKSNETTLRLSRLLALLAPAFDSLIGTLTSTTPYTTRRDTLRSFNSGKLRILVASDLVARGIDLPSLDHVINYDMPSSIASYVHRVGRTARAGNTGKAWTLFTNPEARWFWNEIASEKVIERSKLVERVRVTEEKEDAFNNKVAAYEAALEKLGQEAGQSRHKDRKE